jgi:hypothetical protein
MFSTLSRSEIEDMPKPPTTQAESEAWRKTDLTEKLRFLFEDEYAVTALKTFLEARGLADVRMPFPLTFHSWWKILRESEKRSGASDSGMSSHTLKYQVLTKGTLNSTQLRVIKAAHDISPAADLLNDKPDDFKTMYRAEKRKKAAVAEVRWRLGATRDPILHTRVAPLGLIGIEGAPSGETDLNISMNINCPRSVQIAGADIALREGWLLLRGGRMTEGSSAFWGSATLSPPQHSGVEFRMAGFPFYPLWEIRSKNSSSIGKVEWPSFVQLAPSVGSIRVELHCNVHHTEPVAQLPESGSLAVVQADHRSGVSTSGTEANTIAIKKAVVEHLRRILFLQPDDNGDVLISSHELTVEEAK